MPKLEMVKDGHLGGYIHGGDPGTWCPHLWSWVVKEFEIQSVLDVGCGEGHSTKFFRDLGCKVLGVDGCRQAIEDSVIPDHVIQHDFCDGPFVPERPFDLIWSCEFLEHVEKEYVPNILETFSHAAKVILVTHAFPERRSRLRQRRRAGFRQGWRAGSRERPERGHHHVNCQPSAYWIRLIEAHGFECRVEASRRARTTTLADYPGINHFARSGLLFTNAECAMRNAESISNAGCEMRNVESTGNGRTFFLHSAFRTPHWKALRINLGFRWSAAYRIQQHRRRALKRQKRQSPQ